MTAVVFGLLAAVAYATQALISKDLTRRMPARQLIGPLFFANALVLLPLAPFVDWTWTPVVIVLHLVSVGLMVVTAICVWDLLDHGAASATTTATALSPIPAAVAGSLLLPGAIGGPQVVAAVLVSGGVLVALAGAFGTLGRRGTALRIAGAAVGNGSLTVVTRLIGDEGAGVVETYVVRTALAAAIFLVLIPPRQVPLRAVPRLFGRSLVVTTYFVLVILGAQQGSPVVVQTLVAAAPLIVLAIESLRGRTRPPRRSVAAALVVVAGVAVTLAA